MWIAICLFLSSGTTTKGTEAMPVSQAVPHAGCQYNVSSDILLGVLRLHFQSCVYTDVCIILV